MDGIDHIRKNLPSWIDKLNDASLDLRLYEDEANSQRISNSFTESDQERAKDIIIEADGACTEAIESLRNAHEAIIKAEKAIQCVRGELHVDL